MDGCRFEEVSLGYPGRQWRTERGIDADVRPIVARSHAAPLYPPG